MEEREPHGVRLGDDHPASLPSRADGNPIQFKLAHAQLGLMLFRLTVRSMKNAFAASFLAGLSRSAILRGTGAIMIEDTVSKIEAKIQGADAIKDERKRELLQLLGTLKSEIAGLSKTHGEQAESIAGFTELSAHEATRATQNPELLKLSLEGLSSSVEGFEKSHPRLVQIVNSISNTLSNLGI
jgi:hypothetical protein